MKILVPFDFSKSAEKALEYALFYQSSFGGTVDVMHVIAAVIPPQEMPFNIYEGEQLKMLKPALEELVASKAKMYNVHNDLITVSVDVGSAVTLLLLFEEQKNYDLIVMGTHDKDSLFTRILGSVSTGIIRYSKTPVLIVHSTSKQPQIPKKVLFAIDETSAIEGALTNFMKFNNGFKAKTDFIHFSNTENNVDPQFDQILKKFYLENELPFAFEINKVEGQKPIVAIEKYIQDDNYDLIAMVKNNTGIYNRYFRPSFSNKAIHKTELPVLVYKTESNT